MIPYIILALLSIFFGYVASDVFVGLGSYMLYCTIHTDKVVMIEGEFALPLFIKNLALISVGGAGLALRMYHRCPIVLVSMT